MDDLIDATLQAVLACVDVARDHRALLLVVVRASRFRGGLAAMVDFGRFRASRRLRLGDLCRRRKLRI